MDIHTMEYYTATKMDKPQLNAAQMTLTDITFSKEAKHKKYITCDSFNKVQNHTKLINSVRGHYRSSPWGGQTLKMHKEDFCSAGNILYLNLGGNCTGVYTYAKYQATHIKCVLFMLIIP